MPDMLPEIPDDPEAEMPEPEMPGRTGVLDKLRTFWDRNVSLTLIIHEIRSGFQSRLLHIWLIVTLFFALLSLTQPDIFFLLIFFCYFGSLLAIVLSANSISADLFGIADSLLSRSVRRWEYVVSKYVSQVVVILAVYFFIVALNFGILWNLERLPDDMSYRNLYFIIGLGGLILVFFSTIGVMFSSIFSKPKSAFLSGIVVWFILIFVYIIFPMDTIYSPVVICKSFSAILNNSWDIEYWKLMLFYLASPFVFILISLGFFYQRDF
jgi:ABC-type transport system involved in multi-copper enzyme maturation permease subunit